MLRESSENIVIDKLEFIKPIDIDKNTEIREQDGGNKKVCIRKFDIPKTQGIYMYYNKNMEIMYVGKAKDLSKRYKDHSNEPSSKVRQAKIASNDNIRFYSYALCKNICDIDFMEMIYTQIYKPKLNNYSLNEIMDGKANLIESEIKIALNKKQADVLLKMLHIVDKEDLDYLLDEWANEEERFDTTEAINVGNLIKVQIEKQIK